MVVFLVYLDVYQKTEILMLLAYLNLKMVVATFTETSANFYYVILCQLRTFFVIVIAVSF
jgi:hypothetical protein